MATEGPAVDVVVRGVTERVDTEGEMVVKTLRLETSSLNCMHLRRPYCSFSEGVGLGEKVKRC